MNIQSATAIFLLTGCSALTPARAQETAQEPAKTPHKSTAPAQNGSSQPVRTDVIARLTVRGDAELLKPADQLLLRLGTVSQATEAAQAMEENNRIMNEVVGAIEKLGITKKEFQTGRFQVRPTYSPRPRQPDPNWKPLINGYEVTNTIEIKTQKLELAGQLIEAATKAGANTVESINFDLADKRKHRAEAINTAASNAMADANVLAEASRQRLVRVLSINLDNASVAPPVMEQNMMMMSRGMADSAEQAPINPGDVGVHASVTIVYEVAPMN